MHKPHAPFSVQSSSWLEVIELIVNGHYPVPWDVESTFSAMWHCNQQKSKIRENSMPSGL